MCIELEQPRVLLRALRSVHPEVSAILGSVPKYGGDLGIYGSPAINNWGIRIKIRLAGDGWTIAKLSEMTRKGGKKWDYLLGGYQASSVIDPTTQKELLRALRPSCIAVYPNFADGIVSLDVLQLADLYYLHPFFPPNADVERLITGKVAPMYLEHADDTTYSMEKLRTYQKDYMRLLLFESWLLRRSVFPLLPASVVPIALPLIVDDLRANPSKGDELAYRKKVYNTIIFSIEASLRTIRETYLKLFPQV